jgi:hypothetical protein
MEPRSRQSIGLSRIISTSIAVSIIVSLAGPLVTSFAADASQRVPRSVDAIPRPTELRMGLSQIQYKGYFDRNPRWFSDEQYVSSVIQNSTTPPAGPLTIEAASTPTPTSYSWTGYFIADLTGEWQFQLTADDAAFLWIGNDAVINAQSNSNSSFLGASWPDKVTVSKKISLVKNKIYPMRIQYGNSGGPATFKLSYQTPGSSIWMQDFTTLLWRSPELVGDCTNFGLSYTLAAELGYDKVFPQACKEDGTDKFRRTWIKLKPEIPSLVSAELTSAGFVIQVSLGEVKVSNIYLLSPSIGYSNTSKLAGKISNNVGTFLIPISKLRNVAKIDVNLFSSNEQGTTTTMRKALPVQNPVKSPTSSTKPNPTKKAPAPKSVKCSKGDKSRIFGGTVCPPGWSK